MPSLSPKNLNELRDVSTPLPKWKLDLRLPEIGGGRFVTENLVTIEELPEATALMVSGLDQSTFEQLITRFGSQFSAIFFFKCPRILDLTPLERLPTLRIVDFYWNQRASRLWDFSRTPNLRGLGLHDFTRLRDLSDLRSATTLEELEFGDTLWDKAVFPSLDPLESLVQLRSLRFSARRIEDGRIEPLAKLRGLKSLYFPGNQFTTQQIAWLRAHLPDSLDAESLNPLRSYADLPLGEGGKVKDVQVAGKRKPWLNSKKDAERIKRYADEFWRMVEGFRKDPELLPN